MPEETRISSVEVAALRGLVRWQEFKYGILESPSEVKFAAVPVGGLAAEGYDTGLLFGAAAELRWKRLRWGQIAVVMIDDAGGDLDGAKNGRSLTPLGETERIALWGEPERGRAEWFEPRVPRRITEYPQAMIGRRVWVRLLRYRMDMGSKEPARYLFRCAGLESF